MSDTIKQREQGRQAEESVRQTGQAVRTAMAAETVNRATVAATDTVDRNAEVQRDILLQAQHELMKTSQMIIDTTRSNAEKMRMLMTLPRAAEGGLQDMQKSVVGLVEGVLRTNLTIMEEMLKVKSPQSYIELQQRFVREYLDGLVDGFATLVRATRRTADETLGPLEERK